MGEQGDHAPPEAVRREQRKNLLDAAYFVIGWAVIIGIAAGVFWTLGWFQHPIADSRDVIVFADYKGIQNGLFAGLLFGGAFFLGLLASRTTRLGVAAVCALFLAVAALSARSMYLSVAAIGFQDRAVELRYLWPRPPVRLPAADIVFVDYDDQAHSGDDAATEYVVRLRTAGREYETFADTSQTDALDAVRRIKALQQRR